MARGAAGRAAARGAPAPRAERVLGADLAPTPGLLPRERFGLVTNGLGLICAAREALPLEEIEAAWGWHGMEAGEDFLHAARALLLEEPASWRGARAYRPYHEAFRAFVADEARAEAHGRAAPAALGDDGAVAARSRRRAIFRGDTPCVMRSRTRSRRAKQKARWFCRISGCWRRCVARTDLQRSRVRCARRRGPQRRRARSALPGGAGRVALAPWVTGGAAGAGLQPAALGRMGSPPNRDGGTVSARPAEASAAPSGADVDRRGAHALRSRRLGQCMRDQPRCPSHRLRLRRRYAQGLGALDRAAPLHAPGSRQRGQQRGQVLRAQPRWPAESSPPRRRYAWQGHQELSTGRLLSTSRAHHGVSTSSHRPTGHASSPPPDWTSRSGTSNGSSLPLQGRHGRSGVLAITPTATHRPHLPTRTSRRSRLSDGRLLSTLESHSTGSTRGAVAESRQVGIISPLPPRTRSSLRTRDGSSTCAPGPPRSQVLRDQRPRRRAHRLRRLPTRPRRSGSSRPDARLSTSKVTPTGSPPVPSAPTASAPSLATGRSKMRARGRAAPPLLHAPPGWDPHHPSPSTGGHRPSTATGTSI